MISRVIFLLFALILSSATYAESTVRVAVASNFASPMKALITLFEKNSHHKVKASYASSGKIYAQIKHGAPYDLFFSADQEKPITLLNDGLAVSGSRYTYAIGRLALWSKTLRDPKELLSALKQGKYKKLALANPKLAPYGKGAVETLNHLGLLNESQPKWVMGENISQTFQFVSTANAELGFVALSQLMETEQDDAQQFWKVPVTMHSAIKQDVVLLNDKNEASKAFWLFCQSEQAKQVIRLFGYQLENGVTNR